MNSFENYPIDIQGLPTFESVEFQPLKPAYRWILVVNTMLFFILIFGVMGFIYGINMEEIPAYAFYWASGLLAFALIARLVLLFVAFKKRGWALRTHDVLYRKGVLTYTLVTIPLNRIQHSEIRQSAIARLLGLAKLRIFTAGGNSSDLSIPGLSMDEATQLKDYLSKIISREESGVL